VIPNEILRIGAILWQQEVSVDSQGRLWTHEGNITINQNTEYLIVNNITEIPQTRDAWRDLICTTRDYKWPQTGPEMKAILYALSARGPRSIPTEMSDDVKCKN